MVYCARHFVFVQTPWHFSANLQTSSAKEGALFVSAKNLQVSKRKVARKNAMEAVLRALRGSAGPFPLHYRPAVTATPPLQSRLGPLCGRSINSKMFCVLGKHFVHHSLILCMIFLCSCLKKLNAVRID